MRSRIFKSLMLQQCVRSNETNNKEFTGGKEGGLNSKYFDTLGSGPLTLQVLITQISITLKVFHLNGTVFLIDITFFFVSCISVFSFSAL